MEQLAGMVVGADHIIKNNCTFVRLWIRSDTKQAVCKVFKPYFLVESFFEPASKIAENLSKLEVTYEKNNILMRARASNIIIKNVENTNINKKTKLKEIVKVCFKTRVELEAFRNFIENENEIKIFNSNLTPARQFMLDNNIDFFESFEFKLAGKFDLAGEKCTLNYFLNANPLNKKFNQVIASIYVNSDSKPNSNKKFINWVSVSCTTGEKKQFYNIFNDSKRELKMIEEIKIFFDKISPDFIIIFGKENGTSQLITRAHELACDKSFKFIDFGCDSTPVDLTNSVFSGRTIIDIKQTEKLNFNVVSKLCDEKHDLIKSFKSFESIVKLKLSQELHSVQKPISQKEEIQKRADCLLKLGKLQIPLFTFISKKTCEMPTLTNENFSKHTSKKYLEKIFINAKQSNFFNTTSNLSNTSFAIIQSTQLSNSNDCSLVNNAPKGVYSNVKELTLNNTLLLLVLLKNICPTTMNCDCCKPVFSTDIQRTNCAPSSKVTVVFKKNHFFFTSFDESWALKYHKSDIKNQRAREQLKKQFFLRTISTGPFQKNEKAELLLGDAMELVKTNSVEFIKFNKNQTTWFCKNKNGILPNAILDLDNEPFEKKHSNLPLEKLQKNTGIITYCAPQTKTIQLNNWLKTEILQNTSVFGEQFYHAINSFFTFFTNELKKQCETHGFTFYHVEENSIFIDSKSLKILTNFCNTKLHSNTLKKIHHWNKILLNGPLGIMAGITKEGVFKSIQKQTHLTHKNQKEVIKCFLCSDNKKRNEETLNVAKKYITKNTLTTNNSLNIKHHSKTIEPQLTFFEGFELPVLITHALASNTPTTLKPLKLLL